MSCASQCRHSGNVGGGLRLGLGLGLNRRYSPVARAAMMSAILISFCGCSGKGLVRVWMLGVWDGDVDGDGIGDGMYGSGLRGKSGVWLRCWVGWLMLCYVDFDQAGDGE